MGRRVQQKKNEIIKARIMKTFLELLNMTKDQFEDHVLLIYTRWCMDFSVNYTTDLQKVLANSAINAFFLNELSKVKADFMEQMEPYQNEQSITPDEAKKNFFRCTVQLFNRYPKALLADAKKMNLYAN